jgi:tetratricopeptide (TPR) repeat protein
MDKSRKALLALTSYDASGRTLGHSLAFYVSESGEAVSSFTVFSGAARAEVTDYEGRTLPVTHISAVNDLYDVARFRVGISGKKVDFLPQAKEEIAVGASCYALYSSDKKLMYKEGKVTELTKLKDTHYYYKLSTPIDREQLNAPWLSSSGEVFALAQDDASGKKQASYGVSTSYIASLRYTSVDAFNSMYTRIGIRKAWPDDPSQASVVLFLAAGQSDEKTYLETLDDFIRTFPNYDEGYMSRATHYASNRATLCNSPAECLDKALTDMAAGMKSSAAKPMSLFRQAQIIYNVATEDTTITDPRWSLDAASALLRQAMATGSDPAFHALAGDIAFARQDFQSAYDEYRQANGEGTTYYMAAKSLENIPGAQISDIILMLDSAILKLGRPIPAHAAPYVLERVDYKVQLGLHKEALDDYNLYYRLMGGNVNDRFYYYREQARFKLSDNDGALSDIRQAISLKADPDYFAEEAAILVRLQLYTEAIASIEKALAISPDFASCYRLLGLCHLRLEKKKDACDAFNKARELGDPLVARLIREHCQ